MGPGRADWDGEDEDLFTPEEWADPVKRDEIEHIIAESKASWERSQRLPRARCRAVLRAARLRELQTRKRGAHMRRWQTPEERREEIERAEAAGDSIDWDGMDDYELTSEDWAAHFERCGDLEAAVTLREEAWAEEEAQEAQEEIEAARERQERHERRSAAARKAAQTRKERQAERAAAVAAGAEIFQDARGG
jgi:hypothetical protein